MSDPVSLIALGAAIGGAAGKFVEKAWDSGEKWISSYFANHHEKSQKKAKENTISFLNDLAMRVESLEKSKRVTAEQISSAQEHPDFSVALQKAMISASQTENKEKHQLLSRLVTERIKATPESLIALASKMACDAISYTKSSQLKILGLITNILYVNPNQDLTEEQYLGWLQSRITPFMGLQVSNLDLNHLESLSCLKYESIITRDLQKTLTDKNKGKFNYGTFKDSPLGKFLVDIWENQHLKSTQLTSTGQIIGVMVSDQVTGAATNMDGWE